MNTNPTLRRLGLAALGSLIAAASMAQDSGYYYGGLSVGQSRANIDEPRITASLLAGGLGTTAMTSDERDIAYKLFGGYQFHKNFAVEAGYFNLGKFGFTSTTVPAGTLDGRIRLQGVNIDLVGTLPLTERWSAIARLGAQYADARDRFRGTGAVVVQNPNPRQRDTNLKIGLGLQYQVNPSMWVRAEVERYRVDDAVGNRGDVNLFSINLLFPFGRSPGLAPPRAQAAQSYVASASLPVALPAGPVAVMAPGAPEATLVAPAVVAP